jgi:hypothetical protein
MSTGVFAKMATNDFTRKEPSVIMSGTVCAEVPWKFNAVKI